MYSAIYFSDIGMFTNDGENQWTLMLLHICKSIWYNHMMITFSKYMDDDVFNFNSLNLLPIKVTLSHEAIHWNLAPIQFPWIQIPSFLFVPIPSTANNDTPSCCMHFQLQAIVLQQTLVCN